jgi:hypothetical protein
VAIGGRPEVPGRPRDQMGQILCGPKQIRSVGNAAWWRAPEKDGATLYISGTWDKAKSPVY